MVKADDVRTWVTDERYSSLLCGLTRNLNLEINSESAPDVLFQHDANKLNCVDLELHNLEMVACNSEVVCKYVSQKLKSLGAVDEQEGKSSEDEEDVVLETHAFYRNFLNIHLIELHFLEFDPAGLERYLKAIRIPGAKKYASQIEKIYQSVVC